MSRNDLLARLAAAVVGIVAIAIAAATLRSPVETGGDGGQGTGEDVGRPPSEAPNAGDHALPLFEFLFYALIVLGAIILAWYLITHRREMVKMIAIYLAVGVLVLALVGAFLHFGVGEQLPEREVPDEPPAGEELGGEEPGEGDGDADPLAFGPLLGLLAVLTVIFVGTLFLSGLSDDEESAGTVVATEPAEGVDDAAAVAAAAGRAAERIENTTDVDNEVYRAWREMTGLLEVSRPETSTPGEFADAAVEAGLEREHVRELTRLFEDVRYGHHETTDEMEARAVAVLRRIEEAYPDADDTGGDGE